MTMCNPSSLRLGIYHSVLRSPRGESEYEEPHEVSNVPVESAARLDERCRPSSKRFSRGTRCRRAPRNSLSLSLSVSTSRCRIFRRPSSNDTPHRRISVDRFLLAVTSKRCFRSNATFDAAMPRWPPGFSSRARLPDAVDENSKSTKSL
jgi:hypothetical protein